MYAVIDNGRVIFLGGCKSKAIEAIDSASGSFLINVSTLEELQSAMNSQVDETVEDEVDPLSEAAERLIGILENWDVDNEDFVKSIEENSSKLISEVKHLGTRGMETVGKGFINLGELLAKHSSSDKEND